MNTSLLDKSRDHGSSTLPFRVQYPRDPFDAAFISLCDAESVFTRDSSAARQKLLDSLGYQLIDVQGLLLRGGESEGRGLDITQKLITNMQVSLQYLIHRLGCYRIELKETKKERDDIFDEVVFLRDAAALSQRKMKQMQHQNQHQLQQAQHSSSMPAKDYRCRICGNVYPIQYALTSHMLKRHSGVDASNNMTNNSSGAVHNHSAEWHSTSMSYHRGAALAMGGNETTSPAPKLPSISGGSTAAGTAGQVRSDLLMESLDNRIEGSHISELRSEINHLKRSLESVTVDLRVSQEIQRDRELHFNQAQEEMRRSLSPSRSNGNSTTFAAGNVSRGNDGNDEMMVLNSAETVVLLKNQTNRLEAIERAMTLRNSNEDTMQNQQQQNQQQHAWMVANQSGVTAGSPSVSSPFSIPRFNAGTSASAPRKSSSIDGGNAAPSSGRNSARQAHFAEPAATTIKEPAVGPQALNGSADDMVVVTAATSAAVSPSAASPGSSGKNMAGEDQAAPMAGWRPGPSGSKPQTGAPKKQQFRPPIMTNLLRSTPTTTTPPSEPGTPAVRSTPSPGTSTPIKQVLTSLSSISIAAPVLQPLSPTTTPTATPAAAPSNIVATPELLNLGQSSAPEVLNPAEVQQGNTTAAPPNQAAAAPGSARSVGGSSTSSGTSSSSSSSSGSYTTSGQTTTNATDSTPVSAREKPVVDDIAALQLKYSKVAAARNQPIVSGGMAPLTGAVVIPVRAGGVAPVTSPTLTVQPVKTMVAPVVPISTVAGGGSGMGGTRANKKKTPMNVLTGGGVALGGQPAPRANDDDDDQI